MPQIGSNRRVFRSEVVMDGMDENGDRIEGGETSLYV
jgi:hypothetical protein